MNPLSLTLALGPYGHTRDVTDGTLRIEGGQLRTLDPPIEEIFYRFSLHREWDASEMSMGKYIALHAQDDNSVMALPVFISRAFCHSMFYVREGSAIRRPEDLGKRIGIPEWVQTAGIYGRGYLSDYVGVKLTSIQWIQAGVNEPDRKTYLNDFVIDFDHGAGIAYIIDSGFQAPNAIIVLDLETGRACRRLNDDRSVRASPADVLAEGAPLLVRPAKGSPEPVEVSAVGIALPPHGETLYWTKPDELFSIRTAMLAASTASDEDVSRAVQCWPTRDFASDGLDWDQEGRIYFPDVSNNGVQRLTPSKASYELLLSDLRLSWPDGVALGPDGTVYVTSSQFHRSAAFSGGVDKRRRPFRLFRAKIDAGLRAYGEKHGATS